MQTYIAQDQLLHRIIYIYIFIFTYTKHLFIIYHEARPLYSIKTKVIVLFNNHEIDKQYSRPRLILIKLHYLCTFFLQFINVKLFFPPPAGHSPPCQFTVNISEQNKIAVLKSQIFQQKTRFFQSKSIFLAVLY